MGQSRWNLLAFQESSSFHSSKQQSLRQAKEQVVEYIVAFLCKELAEIEAEKEAEFLSDNLEEYLKVAPAPTTTGKNPLVSNNFFYPAQDASAAEAPVKKESRVERNKLGTVFNQRIIVSPVPYVSTTRESFSTLRKTPILFVDDGCDPHTNNARSGECELLIYLSL